MKKSLSIFLLIVVSITSHAQLQKVDLQASGLTCSMCNKSISTALKNIIFVESVTSDINNNTFIITFKRGLKPDFDLLKKKVEDAGFSVANLWVYANFNQVKVANDQHVTIEGLNLHFVNVNDQVLSGEKKLQLIDKNFIPAKKYVKYASATTMECFKTGIMTTCCHGKTAATTDSQRVYHVTI
jgi:copper chaperone CopZ